MKKLIFVALLLTLIVIAKAISVVYYKSERVKMDKYEQCLKSSNYSDMECDSCAMLYLGNVESEQQ